MQQQPSYVTDPGFQAEKKLNLEQGRPTETATYIHDNPVRVSVEETHISSNPPAFNSYK